MPPKRGRPPGPRNISRKVEDTAASTRRKRVLPQTSTIDYDQQPSTKRSKSTETEVADSSVPPPKRGRGRPSKIINTSSASITVEPVRRGRGRPRTRVDLGEDDNDMEDKPSAEPTKRRGCPKKGEIPETVGGHQQHLKNHRRKAANAPLELPLGEQANQIEANQQLANEAHTAAKRGRGRPKKEPQVTADPVPDLRSKKSTKSTDSKVTMATAGKKRGRGRPKSNNFTEDFAAEMEDEEEEEDKKRTKRAKTSALPANPERAPKRGQRLTAVNQEPALKANGNRRAATTKPTNAKNANVKGTRNKPRKDTSDAAVADQNGSSDNEAPKVQKGKGMKPGAAQAKRDNNAKPVVADTLNTTATVIDAATEEENVDEHGRHLWLMKAEPDSRIENGKDVKFSIDDLAACTTPEPWSGVRNPVARNNMKAMKSGDLAFFYHSNAKKLSGVAGIMEIVGEATPDLTAFDKDDPYFDPKSDSKSPKWFNVHVEFRSKMPKLVTLAELKSTDALKDMVVVKQSRLSVTKVTKKEWDIVNELGGAEEVSPPKESVAEAIAQAPTIVANNVAAIVKDATNAIGDTISNATAAITNATKSPSVGRPSDTAKGGSKRKSRAPSSEPNGFLKTPVPTTKRDSSTQPEQKSILKTVDEDEIVGAVPPAFELTSSPS